MNHLKISVCLATYNGEAYIQQQLTSILTQLNQEDEVIISDDHSTDDTLTVIASFQDNRIKIFSNPNKSGAVTNFENALKQATGEIIFLADQDDVWLPDKVKIQVALLEKNDLVLSDAIVVDELGNVQHPSFFKMNYSGKGLIRNWVNNSYMGCCMAFNRKVLTHVLPFPEKIAMHDSWIGLNASLIGKSYFLNTPLIHYRRHGKNTMA